MQCCSQSVLTAIASSTGAREPTCTRSHNEVHSVSCRRHTDYAGPVKTTCCRPDVDLVPKIFFKTCRDVDIDVPALCLSFSQFLDAGNPILHAAYSAQKGKKLRKSSELCRVVNPEWRRISAGRWTIVAKLGAKSAAQPWWRWLRLQEVGFVNNS